MKRNLLLTLVFAFVACTGAFAQTPIPNGDFENWTQVDTTRYTLDQWNLLSGGMFRMDTLKYTLQGQPLVAAAPSGRYFLGINNANNRIGIVGTKFAINNRPAELKFSAAYFPASGNSNERFAIYVILTKSTGVNTRDTICYARLLGPAMYGNASNPGLIDVTGGSLVSGYRKPGNPDSASIYILADYFTNIASANTFLAVDNLRFGTGLVSGVEETGKLVGNVHNYPNPFSNTTTIAYELRTSGQVSLKVYDISGREVSTLVNTTQGAGKHQAEFNGSDLSEGVYIYQLRAGDAVSTGKMIISK